MEEDSEEDPIYENICDKCKEMNLGKFTTCNSDKVLRPVYTTPDFWYGTDTNGTGAKK